MFHTLIGVHVVSKRCAAVLPCLVLNDCVHVDNRYMLSSRVDNKHMVVVKCYDV